VTDAAPIEDIPTAIVSLSPTATEILFAIGAGAQVVAVDDQSNFPAEAPITDLSGFEPNAEAIAGYAPDLVVVAYAGDVVTALEQLEIPVVINGPAVTIDDTYAQIAELGELTGHIDEAAALVSQMRTDIDALVAGLPERAEPVTFFHELDDTLYSASSATFIGQVYGLLGLTNIADEVDTVETGGYPQLSAEFLLQADPDLIFLADTKCCGQSAESVAARPGWESLTAVTTGRIIPLDDDIASRWGPRVVGFLSTIADAVHTVPV
jgi:iron complex transport system substrate-binding protein